MVPRQNASGTAQRLRAYCRLPGSRLTDSVQRRVSHQATRAMNAVNQTAKHDRYRPIFAHSPSIVRPYHPRSEHTVQGSSLSCWCRFKSHPGGQRAASDRGSRERSLPLLACHQKEEMEWPCLDPTFPPGPGARPSRDALLGIGSAAATVCPPVDPPATLRQAPGTATRLPSSAFTFCLKECESPIRLTTTISVRRAWCLLHPGILEANWWDLSDPRGK